MAVLGSIYHDFPRLAKQSGFYFQLHKGRVNWRELENLNLDEIIQNRNFQLLEQNLLNVINCDLEREYDLKILDQTFVKLFKLAQLGVDYLSYCEMYLDRCVVLLQEQLSAFQEEFERLKQENERKNDEINRSKRKSKGQSYQCEKCEKVFISDVYLKFHDKRRHSSPSTPQSLDGSQKKSVTESYQQTEIGRMLSTSTQTLLSDEERPDMQDNEASENLKMQHLIKIEKLEQEIEEFKERLKKAETFITEKNETSKSHVPFQVPGSMYCNSMLMLLPSSLKHSGNGFYEINPGCPLSLPVTETHQHVNPTLTPAFNLGKDESKSATEKISLKENFSLLNTESQKVCERDADLPSEAQKSSLAEAFQNSHREEKENLMPDKENIDPNIKKNVFHNLTPPLPPPRKSKKETRALVVTEEAQTEEVFVVAKKEIQSKHEAGLDNYLSVNTSTPSKGKQDEGVLSEIIVKGSEENLSEISKPESILNEEIKSKKAVLHDQGHQSLIKKMIKRNSPKLQKFRKSLRRSLTNLYDSVSSENHSKSKESIDRATVVDSLNNRLKQLGIDPEWSGIPRKTMKQKLNALRHRRRLLSKENPTYPAIRRSIEEKIFQKLKKNFSGKKTTFTHKLSKGEMNTESLDILNSQEDLLKDKPEFIKVKKCPMYDIDTDSESKASDSESSFNQGKMQSPSQKSVVVEEFSSDEAEEKTEVKKDQEFDLSVFQVGRGGSQTKNISDVKEDELISESDNEANVLERYDDKTLTKLKGFLNYKSRGENNTGTDNFDNAEHSRKANTENQSILKEGGFQSKTSMNPKKKVLFANCSNVIDEELSDSPLDDELWSLKSDWEKDTG